MTSAGLRILPVLVVALTACHPTSTERATVRRWLLCEECNRGELEAVVRLGDDVTGMLTNALLDGPPRSGRVHIQRQAEDRYKRLRSPQPLTLAAFVSHYDSNYVANYRAHAATALGRIGTEDAYTALFEAMRRDSLHRRDVLRALAAAAPISLDTVAGAVQGAPVDSFVRIDPAVILRDTSTGAPIANVTVVFTVDSGGGRVTDSVRRTDTSGVASTRWALGDVPDSFNLLRAASIRRSVTFRATAHGLTPRVVFVVQPSNVTQGQPITPGVRVAIVDAWDQRDSTFAGTAQLIVTGTGLSQIRPVVGGEATFDALVPNFTGTAFQISVEVSGATPAFSNPFDVTP